MAMMKLSFLRTNMLAGGLAVLLAGLPAWVPAQPLPAAPAAAKSSSPQASVAERAAFEAAEKKLREKFAREGMALQQRATVIDYVALLDPHNFTNPEGLSRARRNVAECKALAEQRQAHLQGYLAAMDKLIDQSFADPAARQLVRAGFRSTGTAGVSATLGVLSAQLDTARVAGQLLFMAERLQPVLEANGHIQFKSPQDQQAFKDMGDRLLAAAQKEQELRLRLREQVGPARAAREGR